MSDSKERGEAFLKEFGELMKKHNYDFVSYPAYIPDGQGGFRVIVQTTAVDTSNQPVPSNFMEKDK